MLPMCNESARSCASFQLANPAQLDRGILLAVVENRRTGSGNEQPHTCHLFYEVVDLVSFLSFRDLRCGTFADRETSAIVFDIAIPSDCNASASHSPPPMIETNPMSRSAASMTQISRVCLPGQWSDLCHSTCWMSYGCLQHGREGFVLQLHSVLAIAIITSVSSA